MFAASVSQYRTMSFSYVNLSRRFQYAVQAYSQTQFYYGYNPGLLFAYDYGYIDRDLAQATQTSRGAHRLRHLSAEPLRAARTVDWPPAIPPGVQRTRTAAARRRLPAADLRADALQRRHVHAVRHHLRPGDDDLPRVRTAGRQHHPVRLRVRAQLGEDAVAPDRRSGCALLHAHRDQRGARTASARLQELGRVPGLHLLRWQLGAPRLRVPRVPRQ